MSHVHASLHLPYEIDPVIYHPSTHMPTFSPFRELPLRVITQDMHCLPPKPPPHTTHLHV